MIGWGRQVVQGFFVSLPREQVVRARLFEHLGDKAFGLRKVDSLDAEYY